MTNADTGLAIWGIDAPLRGTAGAILGLHPAVLLEDGTVAVVRRLGWDPGTEKYLARVGTPAFARRELTELQFVGGAQPRILPHQLFVLIGPTFWDDLKTVLPTDVTALSSPVFEVHSGHRFVLLPAFEYESFAQRLGVKCREAFDRELVDGAVVTVANLLEVTFGDRALWIKYTEVVSRLKGLRMRTEFWMAGQPHEDPLRLKDFFDEFQRILEGVNAEWLQLRKDAKAEVGSPQDLVPVKSSTER